MTPSPARDPRSIDSSRWTGAWGAGRYVLEFPRAPSRVPAPRAPRHLRRRSARSLHLPGGNALHGIILTPSPPRSPQTEADLKQKQAEARANQPDNNYPVTTGQLIGSTPLLDLSQYSLNEKVKIFAKCEYLNPSGSIKDRIAQHIIGQAEASGELKPGMTVVAATSGNTGAAIAMACALRGYDYIVITNEKTSKEKVDAMRAYGGEVIVSPSGVAPDHPDHYQNIEDRLCAENPGTYYGVDQYNNPYNAEAYEATLGPEIWRQTSGDVTHFVAGGSTGGTVSGTGRYLKSENADVRVVMADPKGSVFWDHVVKGVAADDVCVSKSWEMEGVGKDSIPGCFDINVIDGMVRGNDEDAFAMCREVAANDGLLLGGSAGLNLHAARVLSGEVDDGSVIVTVFPDNGVKYLSKIYNDSWLESKGLEGAAEGNGAVSPDVDEKEHDSRIHWKPEIVTRQEQAAAAAAAAAAAVEGHHLLTEEQTEAELKFLEDIAPKLVRYHRESIGGAERVHSRLQSPDDLAETFAAAGVPLDLADGAPVDELALDAAVQAVMDNSVRSSHPLFLNQLYSGVDPVALAGDWLASRSTPTCTPSRLRRCSPRLKRRCSQRRRGCGSNPRSAPRPKPRHTTGSSSPADRSRTCTRCSSRGIASTRTRATGERPWSSSPFAANSRTTRSESPRWSWASVWTTWSR